MIDGRDKVEEKEDLLVWLWLGGLGPVQPELPNIWFRVDWINPVRPAPPPAAPPAAAPEAPAGPWVWSAASGSLSPTTSASEGSPVLLSSLRQTEKKERNKSEARQEGEQLSPGHVPWSSSHGTMQPSWKQCSHSNNFTCSPSVKSSQQTEHDSLFSICFFVILTEGICWMFSLAIGGGPAPSIWLRSCVMIASSPPLPQA